MTDNPSISARTIEALTAIATGLHDIADAVRDTGQFPGRVDRTQSTETAQKLDDRIPVFEDDDPRQAVAHWLDRNYGPAIHALGHVGHDWLAAADDVLEVARTNMPRSVTETGPGATQTDSAGRGASGGLGERLRAAADYQDRPGAHDELRAMADEADRLERERDGARIKGAQWKARYEETRGELRVVDGMLASKPDESENPFRMPEDRAPATDWAKVDHTADQCQFEECPACGCCAHGKEHVIGCSTTLDRPLGTDCPNPDCACKGGMG